MRTLIVLVSLAMMTVAGCAYTHETIPTANIPFAKASYELGGETSAESCGVYIMGVNFANLFGTDTAATSGGAAAGPLAGLLGGGLVEEAEAIYNALQSMPEATHLLSPRVVNTFAGIGNMGMPFFGSRCSTVKAHAVKMGGPNAAQ
jgi:hypothetical protein